MYRVKTRFLLEKRLSKKNLSKKNSIENIDYIVIIFYQKKKKISVLTNKQFIRNCNSYRELETKTIVASR